MNKICKKEDIQALLKDGMTLMVGGFLGCGAPEKLIDILVDMKLNNLTIICNDSGFVDRSVGRLVVNGQVTKVITSHIGTNPESGRRMNEGTMQVELVPQGTLVERIRAGGSGLGGFLTPTGVGTMVEEGKQKLTIDGKAYLLELPLRADVALIKGSIADEQGNTFYRGTTRNFNPIMALAADTVIVEADELVRTGELRPEDVMTPCVLVDYLLAGDN